jgi:hypothetical protein
MKEIEQKAEIERRSTFFMELELILAMLSSSPLKLDHTVISK